jgi:hypothetical protein
MPAGPRGSDPAASAAASPERCSHLCDRTSAPRRLGRRHCSRRGPDRGGSARRLPWQRSGVDPPRVCLGRVWEEIRPLRVPHLGFDGVEAPCGCGPAAEPVLELRGPIQAGRSDAGDRQLAPGRSDARDRQLAPGLWWPGPGPGVRWLSSPLELKAPRPRRVAEDFDPVRPGSRGQPRLPVATLAVHRDTPGPAWGHGPIGLMLPPARNQRCLIE